MALPRNSNSNSNQTMMQHLNEKIPHGKKPVLDQRLTQLISELAKIQSCLREYNNFLQPASLNYIANLQPLSTLSNTVKVTIEQIIFDMHQLEAFEKEVPNMRIFIHDLSQTTIALNPNLEAHITAFESKMKVAIELFHTRYTHLESMIDKYLKRDKAKPTVYRNAFTFMAEVRQTIEIDPLTPEREALRIIANAYPIDSSVLTVTTTKRA